MAVAASNADATSTGAPAAVVAEVLPRPLLTKMPAPRCDCVDVLSAREQAHLLKRAKRLFHKMKRARARASSAPILAAHAKLEPIFVAAALALLTGRFRKKNGKPNPSAAAKAFGKCLTRPSAVTEWVAKLELLNDALQAEIDAKREQARAKAERESKAQQQKAGLARELTAAVRALIHQFDGNAQLDACARRDREAEIEANKNSLAACKFGCMWFDPGESRGQCLPDVSMLELSRTPEFENMAALLPDLPSRTLINHLYNANGSHAYGFKGFEPSCTVIAFVTAKMSALQLRQLRHESFGAAKDRFHELVRCVRDSGDIAPSDIDDDVTLHNA